MTMLLCFFAFVAMSLLDQTLGIQMSLNKNAEPSQSLEIYMNIGNIATVMTLTKPDGSTETCFAPIGNAGGSCTTGLTQDLTTGIATYSITSVVRATDQGVWTGLHGSDTGSINITVLTIPTVNVSQSVTSLTLSSTTSNTQVLTITVTCAYPAVSLGLSFVPTGGGTAIDAPLSTSTCTSTGNTGCTDTDANSYTCDITPQHEATLSPGTYNLQVKVNLDGQYQAIGTLTHTITDTEIIVLGTPSPTVPPKCSCSWLPCGWKCYYMYIIIVVVVVVLVVVTISVCRCCRHGYCPCCTCCTCCSCSACCRRKENEDKYHVDDVNLNNHENGGRSNPSMRHDGTDM